MQGIDVSNHQGLINWPAVARAGYGFAWCKVSEGGTYRDAFAARNLAGAQAAGLLAGGYHFARPASSTPEAQAQLAAGMAKGASLPLVLDLEQDPATNAWSLAQRLDWAGRFLARADALTGHRAALYTGAWFLAHQLGGGGALLSGRLLWLASYGGPAPAGPWLVWQYTNRATVPGVAGGCDASSTTLTRAQLAAYAGPAPSRPTYPGYVTSVASHGVYLTLMIQTRLRSLNYPVVVDGDFGPQTARWVGLFQSRHGCTADGVVGRLTWAALWA